MKETSQAQSTGKQRQGRDEEGGLPWEEFGSIRSLKLLLL